MAGCLLSEETPAGFSFDNCRRNASLVTQGYTEPRATKTGTTIAGVIFDGGVVLGADTRATEGSIVSDKNCSKIHYLTPNIYCCGAGTAADTEMTTRSISSQLELMQMHMAREIPIVMAGTYLKRLLFKYQGYIGAALVLGGVDSTGPHIYSIHPHGSADKLPYTTMGSGSLAAMSVFESEWRIGMNKEEAMKLVRDAIAAGIFNDLGSGSNVDLCVITKDKVESIRPYEIANLKGKRQGTYKFKEGATSVISSKVTPVVVEEVVRPIYVETLTG